MPKTDVILTERRNLNFNTETLTVVRENKKIATGCGYFRGKVRYKLFKKLHDFE